MSISNILEMFKQSSQPGDTINQTIVLPNGAKYTGTMRDGKPNGRGTLTYKNKEQYKGEFLNGLKHGKGQYYYLKGQLYIGDWYQNKKHGKGQYFYQNGNRYTGQFSNNAKHGQGRVDENNGSYYQGYFWQNNKDKTGEYYNALTGIKYMQTYDKGNLLSQSKIFDNVQAKEEQVNAPQILLKKCSKKSNQEQIEQREFSSLVPVKMQATQHSISNLCVSECDPLFRKFDYSSKKQIGEQQLSYTILPQNYFSQSLLGNKISLWDKEQVCIWLNQIGFGDCIDQFKANNVEGDSLLQLKNQDLKELGIGALGDRRILLREIQFLKLVMKSQCLGDSISKFYQQDVTLDLVRELEAKKDKRQDLRKAVIKAVEYDSSSSTSSSDQNNDNNGIKKSSQNNIAAKNKASNKNSRIKQISIQNKVQNYLEKKGIKLTFLIPKDQIQIIRPIGKGGYGQVFEGRWLGQTVAVKKYLKKQGFRNRHIGHFIQQVQVINKLLHPSIVLYMGMCIYDNQYGMITEFMKGGSLFDYLHKSRRRLSQQHIFYILKDVALGMSYLHSKNVLHCDLKSSNVLIDQSWNVKLCDFGLSRVHTTKKSKKKGLRVGTPHWMAPEILKGEKYEYESDVYSYGVLLWEILTQEIPYKNLSTAQIIGLVGNDETHRIQMPKSNNKLFLDIFLLCTERDPKKRPTFKFIVKALEMEEYKYQNDSNIIKTSSKKEIAKF